MAMYKLSINIQKYTAILFNIRNSLSYIRLNITINNIPKEFNSKIQFLYLYSFIFLFLSITIFICYLTLIMMTFNMKL